MNKTLFYFFSVFLVLLGGGSLTWGAVVNQPAMLIGNLLIVIVLSDLLLKTVMHWENWTIGVMLIASFIGVFTFGFLGQYVYIMPMSGKASKIAVWLYGTRWVATFWPIAVLILGSLHLESEKINKIQLVEEEK